MARRTVYLIRHGQHDSKNRSPDRREGGLTALGRRQARLAARRLSGLPIRAIYTSDLHRAAETAAILAEKFPRSPLRASRLLRECIPIIPARYGEYFTAHHAADDLDRDRRQAIKAFERFFKPSRGADCYEIVVCHGNLIRYFACRALHVTPEAWIDMDTHNCGITEITIEANSMKLVSFNDTGHLPGTLRTFV
jgi:broad specificity phosphatase PhoE